MGNSLRRQLAAWLLLPLIVLLAINSVVTYFTAWQSTNRAYDRTLLGSALSIAERIELAGSDIVVDLPYVALEMLESTVNDRVYYRVTKDNGELVTGYPGIPLPPENYSPQRDPVFYDDAYLGETIRVVALSHRIFDDRVKGPVLIQVAETTQSRKALSRDILLDAVMQQCAMIAIAITLMWFGVRRAFTPLLDVRDDISRRGSHDYSPIETHGAPQEVRPLIDAINQHTSRLERLVQAQARFTADAAHQLRTPLTLVNTLVEFALRQKDYEAMRHVIEELNRTTSQTMRLATQLLSLSRAEPDAVAVSEFVRVNLSALARDTTFEWLPAALAKGIDLAYASDADAAWIDGHEVLLHELLSNLIDNAIRYTQPKGHVTVTVTVGDKAVALAVEDDGPGIPPSERERVCERFYRVLGTGADGCGLGLAIVREICNAHGATLRLTDGTGDRGLRVEVRLARKADADGD